MAAIRDRRAPALGALLLLALCGAARAAAPGAWPSAAAPKARCFRAAAPARAAAASNTPPPTRRPPPAR
jgi:hypothetical protein